MIMHIESGIAGKGLRSNSLRWIEDFARQLKIKVLVSARPDGSLLLKADGEEKDLKDFIKKLDRGSIFSSIENFYTKWQEPSEEERNFHILAN